MERNHNQRMPPQYNATASGSNSTSNPPTENSSNNIILPIDLQCKKCEKQYINEYHAELEWCKLCNINYFQKNFTNWTSGNEKIDDCIQEMQLSIDHNDIVFEWIPYSQFINIKEIGKDGFDIVYSAIWKDGPLCYEEKKWTRKMGKKVALKSLHNSQQYIIDEFPSLVKSYSTKDYYDQTGTLNIYGISQNLNTKDYIMVLQDGYCEKCGKQYKNTIDKWCNSCPINDLKKNLKNWTSENNEIDHCIKNMQLNIKGHNDIVFEWIPCNQFNDVKEIGKDGFDTVYSAVWKNGPLYYCNDKIEYIRNQNKKVALKCLHDSQNNINKFLNEVQEYSIKNYGSHNSDHIFKIYGISQDPYTKDYILVFQDGYYCEECGRQYTNTFKWCNSCQISELRTNFITWTSKNKKIDNLIQEIQLKIDYCSDTVIEWIPSNQLKDVKKIGEDDFTKIYSAIWKNGPLYYDYLDRKQYTRNQDEKVTLKCLCNSQNSIDEFLNEVKAYSIIEGFNTLSMCGISQHPATKEYTIVFQDGYCVKCGEQYTNIISKWCKQCQINDLKKNFANWTSGNKQIDSLIQETQLKINEPSNIRLEWIPYNQFNNIKEIGGGLATAIWKNSPLYYNANKKEYIRKYINYKVALKWLYNSQNITEFLNEVKAHLIGNGGDENDEVLQDFEDIENNEDIEMLEQQSKSEEEDDDDIISEEYSDAASSASEKECIKIYGISRNPDTKNYIMVLQNGYCEKCSNQYINSKLEWCKPCLINELKNNLTNWSGNENIDNLIQEIQLKIDDYNDAIFEWIPYNQFDNIKKIGEGGFATVYSATWRDGSLYYHDKKYIRKSHTKVALKCLHDSQNISKEFLNEIKAYSIDYWNNVLPIYGISQNLDTKDYVMVLDYAKGGNLSHWVNENYNDFNWTIKIDVLWNIIMGLEEIHQKKMIHRDFHTGNILLDVLSLNIVDNGVYISDMGLCGKVDNTDKTKFFGVMPYMAPEVLEGEPYTQAADIYSFGMIMYFIATGKQPFANRAHDEYLVLNICKNGIRPEINEPEAPKCYIDLMKMCWDSNPNNRPNAIKIEKLVKSFHDSMYLCINVSDFREKIKKEYHEIEKQFDEAEEYRKSHLSFLEENRRQTTHPQAIYTARYYTNPRYDDDDDHDDNDDDNSLWTLSSNCFD